MGVCVCVCLCDYKLVAVKIDEWSLLQQSVPPLYLLKEILYCKMLQFTKETFNAINALKLHHKQIMGCKGSGHFHSRSPVLLLRLSQQVKQLMQFLAAFPDYCDR